MRVKVHMRFCFFQRIYAVSKAKCLNACTQSLKASTVLHYCSPLLATTAFAGRQSLLGVMANLLWSHHGKVRHSTHPGAFDKLGQHINCETINPSSHVEPPAIPATFLPITAIPVPTVTDKYPVDHVWANDIPILIVPEHQETLVGHPMIENEEIYTMI
jgi:hypothetical protein